MNGRLPKLDERLRAVAAVVREGSRCADIGCDHGYLIAWLAASGRIPSGYACDINQKPLDRAAFTLSEYCVRDRVKLVLCDGLSGIAPGTVEDIVITGMGGELIWEIICAQDWTRDPSLRFVLQPMTKPERLRTALCRNGFEILRETAAVSGGFPYAVMQVAYTGTCREPGEAFALCGLLLTDPSEAARQYVAKAARLVRERRDGLARSGNTPEECARLDDLLRELNGGLK